MAQEFPRKGYVLRDIGKALKALDLEVVISPDHPFLSRGPDVLAYKTGSLFALFLPTRYEQDHPYSLMARAGLSRVALPAGTRQLLLTRDPVPPKGHETVFDGWTHWRGWNSLRGVGEPIYGRPLDPIPDSLRSWFFQRSALIDKLQGLDGMPLQQLTTPLSQTTVLRGNHRITAHIAEGVWVEKVPGFPDKRLGQVLRRLSEDLFAVQFSMDNGVPYPVHSEVGLGVLYVSRLLKGSRGDPGKPLRCASFAGWLVRLQDNALPPGLLMDIWQKELRPLG